MRPMPPPQRLLARVDSNRTRRNGFKLRQGRFGLDTRRKFFHTEGGDTGTGCPRRLEAFKARLDVAPGSLV